jgi:hypothetical protein
MQAALGIGLAGSLGYHHPDLFQLIPLSNWQIAMSWQLTVTRCACGGAVGVILGLLIGHFGNPNVGVSVSVLGSVVGALLSLTGVSLGRTLRLLVATLVTYNVKGPDRMYEWVDRDQPETDQPNVVSDRFTRWVMGADVVHRRTWLAVTGCVVGLIAGGILAVRDCSLVNAQQQGIVLPMQGSKDPLVMQAILLTLAWESGRQRLSRSWPHPRLDVPCSWGSCWVELSPI